MAHYQHLIIGSNRVINTPSVLVAKDEKLVELEYDRGRLLATVTIRASDGAKVGRLVRNRWADNHAGYEITTNPTSIKLLEPPSNTVVFEARVFDKDTVEITRGMLYVKDGRLIVVEPNQMVIDGTIVKGCTFMNCGTGFMLG